MTRLMWRAFLIAGVFVLAGCGGSGSSPTSTPTGATVPSASESLGSIAGQGVFGEKCLAAAQALAKAGQSISDPSTDLGDQMSRAASAMSALEGQLPSGAVQDAAKTLADAYSTFAGKVKGLHYTPSPGQVPPPALIAAIQSFSDPKFAAAAQTLSGYFSSKCKS